jgi:uncharacterized membrane protein
MAIMIVFSIFGGFAVLIALFVYGASLYDQYPGRSVGRFAGRVVHLAAGIILGPIILVASIFMMSGRNPGFVIDARVLLLIPLLSIIAFGVRYWNQSNWRSRIELLGLCVLIGVLSWIIIPGFGLGVILEAVNEFYVDDYTRFLSNDQYMLALSGAILALSGLCALLIWRAGRLARRYAMPAPVPQ